MLAENFPARLRTAINSGTFADVAHDTDDRVNSVSVSLGSIAARNLGGSQIVSKLLADVSV